MTIIMSTHYMIEAETLCDRLAIMDHGNILDIGRLVKWCSIMLVRRWRFST